MSTWRPNQKEGITIQQVYQKDTAEAKSALATLFESHSEAMDATAQHHRGGQGHARCLHQCGRVVLSRSRPAAVRR